MAEALSDAIDIPVLVVNVADLTLDPANARVHPEPNIASIKASLVAFGQMKPIVVQEEGMIVRAGNGTVEAARELGWTQISAYVKSMTNTEAVAYAIADNRTAETAEWDPEALGGLLTGLRDDDMEMLAATGFSEGELDELLDSIHPPPDVFEDPVPDFPDNPVAKRGQLWALGRHRVLCGDSTKAEDVARLPAFDAVVSDPPYGMNYTGTAGTAQRGMANSQRREVDPVVGDDQDFDPAWVLELTTGDVLLFGGDWFHHRLPGGGSWIIWDKRASEAADATPGAPFEVCWSRRRQERRFIRCPWGGWINKEEGETERHHPTQKPVAVMAECIKSTKGETILDPFLGSGTTMVAAHQLGRTCYGIEVCENYVDVALTRWQNLTGDDAILESTGQTFNELSANA